MSISWMINYHLSLLFILYKAAAEIQTEIGYSVVQNMYKS